MSKTRMTVTTCDICGNQTDDAYAGVVRLNEQDEIRFDICDNDKQKLFGEIKPSARRGRRAPQAA